jgi:hypothetical protein
VQLQNGVKLFPAGATKKDIGYAIASSRTRRRLYKEGKYLPTAHAYIWPRKEFLLFAEKNRQMTS